VVHSEGEGAPTSPLEAVAHPAASEDGVSRRLVCLPRRLQEQVELVC